jgi:vitamin B12 transporter
MGATSVPQVLARLPGIQTLTNGDVARVYIRGADAYMTALYVDGVRVFSQDGVSGIGGGVPWELIPVSQIDHIEVLRGPASAIYGSDAMGGVVHIFTRKGEVGFRPFMNLGIGSYGMLKTEAGLSGAQSGWDYALGLGYRHTDGFNTRPDFVRESSRESSKQQSSSLRLGYQIEVGQRLELTSMQSTVDSQFPFVFYDANFAAYAKEIPAQGTVNNSALKWEGQWTPDYRTSLTVSRSTIAKTDGVPSDYETRQTGALFENYLKVGFGTVSAFLEQRNDSFSAKAVDIYNPAFQGSRDQNALAFGYSVSQAGHAVQLNLRQDRDSLYGVHPTGALTYGYALNDQWRFTASSGTAFKAPTLEQIYSPYGDPQLNAETNASQELGLRYAYGSDTFRVAMHDNRIRNLISSSQTLTSCSAGYFCYYNVGAASIRGVTLSGSLRINHFDLKGSLDMLDPHDDLTGRALSLRARETATLQLNTDFAGWQLGAELQHVGSRFNEASNTNLLAAYDLLNLSAGKALGQGWRFLARVDNVTDQVYVQALGYDTAYATAPIVTPRATYFVGLQWRPNH